MKTFKKVFKKTILFSMLTLFVILTQSCDTEIPPEDSIPPKFSFQITGDGFHQTFDEETDFDSFQLNLREGASYDFVFGAGDPDGMKQIQWQFESNYVTLETAIPSRWEVSTPGLSTFINWFGDETRPVTGFILNGTFRANGDLVGHVFRFMAKDFGGTASNENITYGSLNIFSGNHTTKIRSF